MGGRRRQRAHERKMMEMQQKQLDEAKAEREIQRKRADIQKAEYRAFEYENPYAAMTVDTRAADYQKEMADQSRATIMSQFRGAAGASGVAGLAQALANQGTLQARQVSLNIAQQERQNELYRAMNFIFKNLDELEVKSEKLMKIKICANNIYNFKI